MNSKISDVSEIFIVNSLSADTRVSPLVVYVVYLMGLVIWRWLFDAHKFHDAWREKQTRIEKIAQFGDAKPFNHLELESECQQSLVGLILLNLARLTARSIT